MRTLTLEQWRRRHADPDRRPETQAPIGDSTADRRRTDAERSAIVETQRRDTPSKETR